MKKAELIQAFIGKVGKLNKFRLEQLYEIMELFRKSGDLQEYKSLTDIDYEKIGLIGDILRLNNARQLRSLRTITFQMQKNQR